MMSASYSYRCFIPFHLADPAGILFFGHSFSLAHEALEQFVVSHLKTPWDMWFQNPDWVVPIRHTEANFLHPIKCGQECTIDLSVISSTSSSFTLHSAFHQDILCCTIKTVHVFCNRTTKQKIAIPHAFQEKLLSNQAKEIVIESIHSS